MSSEDSLYPCERGPLAGVCVMVTRAESPSDPLARQLRQLGAEVVVQPAIQILPPPGWQPVDDALARLHEFDWLVFSSANGVRFLLDRAKEKGFVSWQGTQCWCGSCTAAPAKEDGSSTSIPMIASKKRLPTPFPRVAAIGPGTADELRRCGLPVDLVPEQFRAEALAEALLRESKQRLPTPFSFLLVRASRGRDVLAEQLTAAGAEVEQIVVYTSADVTEPDPNVAALLRGGRIDWITVTSSAIARSLAKMFGGELRSAKLASISPLTSGVLRELGFEPTAEAAEYTLTGLSAAIVGHR
jgi:uroporphyrinogen III methyltransferase/synthase